MHEKVKNALCYVGTFALGSILAYGFSKHLDVDVKRVIRNLDGAGRDISTGTRKVDEGVSRLKDWL